jgi:hypothetical protein
MSLRRLALLTFCVVLAACSKVNQENYAKLSAGMPKAEVESLLGKPTDCSGALGMSSCTWGDKNSFISVQYAEVNRGESLREKKNDAFCFVSLCQPVFGGLRQSFWR